jgi:hypothetical protein
VLLGAPNSLASTIVVGPHHAAVTHLGDSSEGSGPAGAACSIWFGKGSQESAGLSSCVLVAISPRRAKWWGVPPRDALGRHPPPPTPAAGAPPAGPWQEPNLPKLSLTDHVGSMIPHVSCIYQQVSGYILA